MLTNQHTENRKLILGFSATILLAIIYGTHLTWLEIDPRVDEIRRGLVSLEMILSGNYWVPTINGEPYLNKPPLYNWLLAFCYKTMGINELALRLPMYISIFIFGFIIYRFARIYVKPGTAMLASLFFMTNGRILIYDSLMGLIDVLYSSLVFLSFMLVWHFGKKEKWYALFISTYILVSVGYLMKGLPSLVYQAFVLVVYFTTQRKWKILFSPAHFAGIAVMLLLLGGYYWVYFSKAAISPQTLFGRIITESTMRTYKDDSNYLKDFIIHFATYPIQFAYHYAPWSIFLLLVIRPRWITTLFSNQFVKYSALLFFACLFIYWLSPYIMARYMFMILPLAFIVAAYYYEEVAAPEDKVKRILDLIFIGLLAILGFGSVALPFIKEVNHLPNVTAKALLLSICLLVSAWLALKNANYRIWFIIFGIIFVRMGFNWFVVEQRGQFSIDQRHEAEKVMEIANGRAIFFERGAELGNPDGLSFNIALQQQRIVPFADSILPGSVYITDSISMVQKPHKVLYRWGSQFQPNHYLVEYLKVP